MRIRGLIAAIALVVAATVTASPAAASAAAFCADLGADFDGQYCRTQIVSQRNAVRDIKVAVPGELIDDPVAGPVVRDYLGTLVDDWRRVGTSMVADSFGEANVSILRSDDTVTAVFRETYHADGPAFNNAYRTFTFDTANGRRVQLADLTKPGIDPLVAIPPLAQPFVVEALDRAPPAHQPGSYPFVAQRWTPDKVYSGAYKAWALTADELILYMPDYPVAHDVPLDYTPGVMQWSMDGGTVQAHIPLSALTSVLRPAYGGT
jgi:hypothetical protein